jgi:hypothetical protein
VCSLAAYGRSTKGTCAADALLEVWEEGRGSPDEGAMIGAQ